MAGVIRAQFGLFTILPSKVSAEDFDSLAKHFWTVPLMGLFFGTLSGLTFLLANQFFVPLLSAVLAIMMVHLFNRFLHLDGLSDLGDGLLCGGTKEKKMAVMKDSRSGAGGIAYVLFFELLGIAALSTFGGWNASIMFFIPLAAEVLAKNALLTCAAYGEPSDGLGGAFVRNTRPRSATFSSVLSLAIVVPLAYLLSTYSGWSPLWTAVICAAAVAVSALVGWTMSRVALRHFGIVNGDVLGATNEIARPVVLMLIIVVIKCLESARL